MPKKFRVTYEDLEDNFNNPRFVDRLMQNRTILSHNKNTAGRHIEVNYASVLEQWNEWGTQLYNLKESYEQDNKNFETQSDFKQITQGVKHYKTYKDRSGNLTLGEFGIGNFKFSGMTALGFIVGIAAGIIGYKFGYGDFGIGNNVKMIVAAIFPLLGTFFIISLTGALAPGPLTTVSIVEGSRRGKWSGWWLAVGHALVEAPYMALIVLILWLGREAILQQPLVAGLIALVGGGFLAWMGWGLGLGAWRHRWLTG